jgi:hypothetical protein
MIDAGKKKATELARQFRKEESTPTPAFWLGSDDRTSALNVGSLVETHTGVNRSERPSLTRSRRLLSLLDDGSRRKVSR